MGKEVSEIEVKSGEKRCIHFIKSENKGQKMDYGKRMGNIESPVLLFYLYQGEE